MKVAIVGYGSMGREVEKVLLDRGHQVSARVDPSQSGADAATLTQEVAKASDMAIEFSHPDAAVGNAAAFARFGLSAVSGTTGWFGKLEEVRNLVAEIGRAHV